MSRDILLTKFIDHTNLNPLATITDIRKLCAEAIQYNFKSVCIHPAYIEVCKEELKYSDILICTVVGFPLGQNTTEVKVLETIDACNNGADEIDMVLNLSQIKSLNKIYLIREINAVVKAANGRVVKVITENCLLTEAEKLFVAEVVALSNATFIKTSTGFAKGGATFDDVELWEEVLRGTGLQIKAAGGIQTYEDLIKFIDLGATRIGTSKACDIIKNTREVVSFVDAVVMNNRKTRTLQESKIRKIEKDKYIKDQKQNEKKESVADNDETKLVTDKKKKRRG